MTPATTTHPRGVTVDAVIFGGGVSGLWTLDVLIRAGYRCVLLESDALGAGQTVGSQGIIHGGLKYTLAGALTGSAEAIREMPRLWRDALAGNPGNPDTAGLPDLSATCRRSGFCHLWRTGRLGSRLGMVGARVGLRVKPQRLPRSEWPAVLVKAGDVFRLEEQVVSPPSLLAALAALHPDALRRYDAESLSLERDVGGKVTRVTGTCQDTPLSFLPGAVVLTAGLGNAALREAAGITDRRMQRRGVHMILAREARPGSDALPALNGHCIDGNKTRVTITSDTDAAGRTLWQVGGQVSEDGTDLDRDALLRLAVKEVAAALGGRDDLTRSDAVEWTTYRLDKAEVTTAGGRRPDDAFVERRANVITCWPTKLALAPRLAERVLELVDPPAPCDDDGQHLEQARKLPGKVPGAEARPKVADPPWDTATDWTPGHLIPCDDARSATPACS